MRAHTNVLLKDRKQLTLSDFRGADFSSSVTQAASARATKMRNLINRGGVNRKRNGWNEILQIEGNPSINGVFEYNDTLIIHAGTRFYQAIKQEGKYSCTDITDSSTYGKKPSRLLSRKSQAFLQNERLYIVGCGDYLVFGTWNSGKSYELRRVADDTETYVPEIARVYGEESLIPEKGGKVEMLSPPNILSKARKCLLFADKTNPSFTDNISGQTYWIWRPVGQLDEYSQVSVDMDVLEQGEILL